MVRKYVDGSGKKRVCGGKDLKGSQTYPRERLEFALEWGWRVSFCVHPLESLCGGPWFAKVRGGACSRSKRARSPPSARSKELSARSHEDIEQDGRRRTCEQPLDQRSGLEASSELPQWLCELIGLSKVDCRHRRTRHLIRIAMRTVHTCVRNSIGIRRCSVSKLLDESF